MVRIKVCGLTRARDVKIAVKMGIDCLGFILAESPRQISLKQAEILTKELPPFISTAGVLVNPTRKQLNEVLKSNIFDYLQFHGEEDPQLLKDLPVRIIKSFSISTEKDLQVVSTYKHVDFYLFDTRVGTQRGGTGKKFNWNLLTDVNISKQFILAGGLGPENIVNALSKVKPAAVDINSKIEDRPGIKNRDLLKDVVTKIRNYE